MKRFIFSLIMLIITLAILFGTYLYFHKKNQIPHDESLIEQTEIEPTQAPSQKPTPAPANPVESVETPVSQPSQPSQTTQPSQSQSTTVIQEQPESQPDPTPEPTPEPQEPEVSVDIPLPKLPDLSKVLEGIL